MRNGILNLIKKSCYDESAYDSLESIYVLYEQLQYGSNLDETARFLYDWLRINYKIDNINFSLYDLEKDISTVILKEGKEFFLDGEFTFYFIISTHTQNNAVVSFSADNKEHYDQINKKREFLEAAFFQISPILQNGIIKKYHVEASSIDSVTHVYNRKYFIEYVKKIITLSKKGNNSITLLMIGVDRFKAVIDEFDYDIGDKVLVELAKVIHGNINEFDIVARLTGDEFLVALVDLNDLAKAQEIAKNIIEQFAKSYIVIDENKNRILKKTCCVGISTYPNDSDDIEQVLKNADSFLYEAKNKGRSSYAVFKKEEESSIDLF